MTGMLRITRALDTDEHLKAVLDLIDEASAWLRVRGTDQWAKPWPDRAQRDNRIWRGAELGNTWIVWDGSRAAATVTVTRKPNLKIWSSAEHDPSEPAFYVHRLVTARSYAGRGLGAQLIDWTGRRGRHLYGARWIRIDVWTSNTDLHRYYKEQGFEQCGYCHDPRYPSGALFQKPVSGITHPVAPLIIEADDPPSGSSAGPVRALSALG